MCSLCWWTDEKNFDLWMDADTIATAKMYPGTYCNDCVAHTTTFTNPTPNSGTYYWVVSAVFPERDDVDGNINIVYQGSGVYYEPVEEDDTQVVCFSGDSTVQRDDGSEVQLRDLRIGESILAVDTDGSLGYSLVTAVPHGGSRSNKRYATFYQIHHHEEENGRGPLEVTRDHLVLTCSQNSAGLCSTCPVAGDGLSSSSLSPLTMLTASQDVTPDMCILAVDKDSSSWTPVTTITKHASRKGLYSVVTQAAYPVVSGVAASPFAHSHVLAHAFHSYLQPLTSGLMRMFLGINPDSEGRVMSNVAEGFSLVVNSVLSSKALLHLSHGVHIIRDFAATVKESGGLEL